MKKVLILLLIMLVPSSAFAMHIMEGFLPKEHAALWLLAAAPFLFFGAKTIAQIVSRYPERKMILGLAASFIFVISALKIPSITGSSSHATGVGLSAVLFGPAASSVLSGIVLLFQAVLLAHGGLTTWGANVFSMGVAGAFAAWAIFRLSRHFGAGEKVAVFLAAFCGDLVTYVFTAGQLALAFPDPVGGFGAAFGKFLSIFALTQLPLAVSEGLLSVVVYNGLLHYGEQGLLTLWWRKNGGQGA